MKRIGLVLLLGVVVGGCGGAVKQTATAPAEMAPPVAPPVLDHSVFARDPGGQLTEDGLQTILDSRLVLDLPARVGILPVIPAADWRGPSPAYDLVPPAVQPLAAALRGGDHFSLITEMMPIPSGALGMEALREEAARYKLHYVLLYREDTRSWTRANPWAVGYATILGAFFMPGKTLHVDGFVEASLFDVKTGLLLFTVRRRVDSARRSNEWHISDKLAAMKETITTKAAPDLADDVKTATYRLAEALTAEDARHAATPPAAPAAGATATLQ